MYLLEFNDFKLQISWFPVNMGLTWEQTKINKSEITEDTRNMIPAVTHEVTLKGNTE